MNQKALDENQINIIKIFATVFGPLFVKFRQHEQVAELNEHLARKNRHLEDALESLAKAQRQLVENQKMAALGMLVKGIAHELNTPIGNALVAVSEVRHLVSDIQTACEDSTKKEEFLMVDNAIGFTENNIQRSILLINKFKKIAVNDLPKNRDQVLLKSCLQQLSSGLKISVPNFNLQQLEINVDPNVDSWSLPEQAFEQVMTHLISNAFTHGFDGVEGGKVVVSIDRISECNIAKLKIWVADNGIGMSKDQLNNIFNPFYTRDRGKGSGLGMSIVHNLINHVMSGTITAAINAHGGLTFELTLPEHSANTH